MLGQGGAGSLDRDGLSAQTVLAVRQAAGHGAVRDQAYAVVPEGVEGEPHHGGVDVHVIGDQLHLGIVLHGCNDRAGRTVGDAGHGIVQVGHVGGTGFKGLDGGVVVGAGVGDGDAHLVMALLDKVQIARLFGGNVHQLDQTARTLLQTAEHGGVCALHILRVLCAHLFGADEGAFHVDAHKVGTLAVFMGGSGVHYLVQDLLGVGHGGGADGQHALAGLKIRQRLDGLLGAVAEILAHCPVEVDIHKARQGVQPLGVQHLFALFRGGKGHDAAIADDDGAALKGVARGIDQCILKDHTKHLVLLLFHPV